MAKRPFVEAFGPPSRPTANGVFLHPALQSSWLRISEDIGAGWFLDGFMYLFGEGLEVLQPCLDAWSFVVPPCDDRRILGRNAYGAILVQDHGDEPERERVFILDPFTVTYDGPRNVVLKNLVGHALPNRQLASFLDDRAYREWCTQNKVDGIDLDDVLGIKVPKPLGGELVAENLQLDGIVDYYRTTAPIYAKALGRL